MVEEVSQEESWHLNQHSKHKNTQQLDNVDAGPKGNQAPEVLPWFQWFQESTSSLVICKSCENRELLSLSNCLRGPYSLIWPCSRIMIVSARCTVLRRCAMMMAVRPRSSRSMACSSNFSVTGSSREDASSSTMTAGSLRKTRAKASN